jgi:hypothetical protein
LVKCPKRFDTRLDRNAADRRNGRRPVDPRKAWRGLSADSRRAGNPQRSGCGDRLHHQRDESGVGRAHLARRSFASPLSFVSRWRHLTAQSSKELGSVNKLCTSASPSGLAAASHSRRNIKVKSAPSGLRGLVEPVACSSWTPVTSTGVPGTSGVLGQKAPFESWQHQLPARPAAAS